MSKKVLVCDDDVDIIEIISIILGGKGYQVFSVNNSEDVKSEVSKVKPDVILMDLWLPEVGGEQATKLLKSDKETAEIPVIILSASINIQTIAQGIGADGYLSKPFETKDLIALIEQS